MQYKKRIDVEEVAEFARSCGPDTKIYLGCDSERLLVGNVWYADYVTAAVIHVNGNNGCKIFGAVDRERDYDQNDYKPRLRLMNEVYRVAELFIELSGGVDLPIEVHLDLNPNEIHNSSLVINEAVGYIRGTCNVIPLVKPRAFAASYAADRFKDITRHRQAA